MRFDGSVSLHTTESIDIPAVLADRDADATVSLTAPAVTLNSNSFNARIADGAGIVPFSYTNTQLISSVGASDVPSRSTLAVAADTIVLGIGSVAGVHELIPLSDEWRDRRRARL